MSSGVKLAFVPGLLLQQKPQGHKYLIVSPFYNSIRRKLTVPMMRQSKSITYKSYSYYLFKMCLTLEKPNDTNQFDFNKYAVVRGVIQELAGAYLTQYITVLFELLRN